MRKKGKSREEERMDKWIKRWKRKKERRRRKKRRV